MSPLRSLEELPVLQPKHLSAPPRQPLSLGIPSIDEALPDGGFPSGSVVELCAPNGVGRATHIALSACAAAQRASRQLRSASDWTAWIDPTDTTSTLFAPALVRAGIDLKRLLVVRPQPENVARVAVRLATSRLFRVIVVDRCGLPGSHVQTDRVRWSTVVRRLALAAESSDTTIFLLTTTSLAQRERLPTAMRIELSRRAHDHLQLDITKDRRGRLPGPVSVPLTALDQSRAA